MLENIFIIIYIINYNDKSLYLENIDINIKFSFSIKMRQKNRCSKCFLKISKNFNFLLDKFVTQLHKFSFISKIDKLFFNKLFNENFKFI